MQKEDFHTWLQQFLVTNNIQEYKNTEVAFLAFKNYKTYNKSENTFVVFEDWWIRKPNIIKSKISAILGINRRIFARNCEIRKINKIDANKFLDENHIYGSTASKHKIGLFYKDELVSVASFAGQRKFVSGKSAEMLRFCNKNFTTVVGGLSKLLKSYIRDYKPDNIMTYVDVDWGLGKSFLSLGFQQKSIKEQILFYCNRSLGERIPEKYFTDFENIIEYECIENSGSIKYILELKK